VNRLWVRLSLMITGVLFLVFLWQFGAILVDAGPGSGPSGGGAGGAFPSPPDEVPTSELLRRLLNYLGLSFVVGIGGGILVGRVVGAPVSGMARAARRIGAGDLATRVTMHGSREMRELAATINGMAAELERAEAARRNLMADISHELRTPLAVLEGNLQAALDRVYPLDDAGIANLYQQVRHLIRLVNDLRELALAESRQLPLERGPLDLSALAAETVQALEPLGVEQGVRLSVAAESLPPISADTDRLRQVLFNLLSNALRHTPPGGEVVVTVAAEEGRVRLEVRDTGEGLASEELAAVFDRFYRADRSRSRETGGSGLGLAIVKGIVEAHGGMVEAQSDGRGRGSTFTVRLPA
jgi:signal transduction histidine kinase